jgi:hypothetical protein
MVPKHVYENLDPLEQKLWHSHEHEVASGMLVLPKPKEAAKDEWEAAEIEAMKEVSSLYGKTWHFWQVDKGDELPLGEHAFPPLFALFNVPLSDRFTTSITHVACCWQVIQRLWDHL